MRRFFAFLLVFLFAFAQQEAMLHAYTHLASEQHSGTQNYAQNTDSSKQQSPAHSEICEKCVALAGIGSAVNSNTPVLAVIPAPFERSFFVAQAFYSSTSLPYRSRAPPSLA